MSKDRARPFSRKHRRYWIPVTGGMVLIGIINVVIGYWSYTKPSDVHERILPDVPYARGSGSAVVRAPATGCVAEVSARISADMPGAVILACAPDHVTIQRGEHQLELALTGSEIRGVAELLTLPEIPAAVMRAFAVAYPKTIPASAVKRSERGADPIYELAFPPGAAHALATFHADGSQLDVR